MLSYIYTPEFEKDFKALLKSFKTLEEDFKVFKTYALKTFYEANTPTTAFVPIKGCCGESYVSNKVKKFSCRSLKNRGSNSGIRIIFIWEKDKSQITFIEIYYKGDKANEDQSRLKEYIKKIDGE